ncbi:unnamed protein product, partial [marine sediment metagenome]
IDQSTDISYRCLDNTNSNALWVPSGTSVVPLSTGISVYGADGGSFTGQQNIYISGASGMKVECQGTLGITIYPDEAEIVTAKVNEGGGITIGNLVYQNGATGPHPQVGLADKDGVDSSHAIGIALETAADNAEIRIGFSGLISGTSTSYGTAGDEMYLINIS